MRSSTTWLALLAACAIAWIAYAPGLHGGFLFDDFVNLPSLGAMGPIDDWPAFWRYITSGSADPTGRPLALLSFLIDARDWPADPHPFLVTNLALHLANGLLLFALLRALGIALATSAATPADARRQANASAAIAAAAWLLHPLFVSTTLYIVQREAMLSTTFVLLGLLAYAHGRLRYPAAPRTGLAWMLVGLLGGTLLAVACKANGVLLPLLMLVLDATVFARSTEGRLRLFRRAFLIAPSLLVLAFLLWQLRGLDATASSRDWTIGQRLLTEPRVLVDYLRLLAVPRVVSTGLFNDAYAPSTGWLAPATTLPALLFVMALVVTGAALCKRWPSVSAAILFFFAGHALESTSVPLELYYEHRNYLPAMLAFWPLARGVCSLRRPAWQSATVAVVALGLLAATTWQRASLWGHPDALALAWAARNPESPRAQASAAMAETGMGRPDLAELRLAPLANVHPEDLQLVLNLADARCTMHGLDSTQTAQVSYAFRLARTGYQLAWSWLDGALDRAAQSTCTGISLDVVAHWIDAAASNPGMRPAARRQDIDYLRGKLALLRGQDDLARAYFDKALDAWPTPTAAARQAAMLGAHGFPAQGLLHLEHFDTLRGRIVHAKGLNMAVLHQYVLAKQHYWDDELDRLSHMLKSDLHQGHRGE